MIIARLVAAILDTNVLVQASFASPRSASLLVLRAYDEGWYRLIFSPSTLDELIDVLLLPAIRARHGWSDDQVLRFTVSLLHSADIYLQSKRVTAALTRDVSDTKFLGLAEESSADYLVTNDRRHLLRLGRYGQTRIVTPAQFLRELR